MVCKRLLFFLSKFWSSIFTALSSVITRSMSCLPIRGMKSEETVTSQIYHERQYFELCALHALNNVFQDPDAFSKEQLDEICSRYRLS